MSFQTFVTQQLSAINTALNNLDINAKRIFELPEQTTLVGTSYVHVDNGGVSQKLQIQKIIDSISQSYIDRLVYVGPIEIDGNDIIIPAGVQALISGITYFTDADVPFTIAFAEAGKTRTDIIVMDTGAQLELILGVETDGVAVRPNIPLNTVLVTQINVTEESITAVPGLLFMGEFESLEVLEETLPSALPGSYAIVNDGSENYVYFYSEVNSNWFTIVGGGPGGSQNLQETLNNGMTAEFLTDLTDVMSIKFQSSAAVDEGKKTVFDLEEGFGGFFNYDFDNDFILQLGTFKKFFQISNSSGTKRVSIAVEDPIALGDVAYKLKSKSSAGVFYLADEEYVDDGLALKANLAGSTSQDFEVPTTPIGANSAVSKNYIDNITTGITWKQAVKCSTTANQTLSGTSNVDGVTVPAGTRVLVRFQTTASENGIYITAAGAWTRATDADTAAEVEVSTVLVQSGTLYKQTQWTQSNTITTLGTDPVAYVQISGAGTYTASTGLSLTSNVFSIIASSFGAFITSLTAKNTLVDADTVVSGDSAASGDAKKTTWLNVWTNYLKPKTDALYQTLSTFSSDVRATLLTGFTGIAGTITSSDSILSAINKIVGNQDLKLDKSAPAYTFRANNTNATANVTDNTFKQFAEQNYTGTEVWTAGTAPSSPTARTHNWSQIGNIVSGSVNLTYTTPGATCTIVVIPLPSDWPTPKVPTGRSGASVTLYPAVGFIASSLTVGSSATNRSYMRRDSGGSGYELVIVCASISAVMATISITYPTT